MGDATARTIEPRGHVVDVRGEPIVGASVTLLRCEHVIGEQQTGDDGGFRFAPVQVSGDDWLEVVAASNGSAACRQWWRGNLSVLRLVLRKACELRGRVTGDDGGPLAGVEVTVGPSAGRVAERQSTRTAHDGSFHFGAVAIGRTTVMAFLDGWQLAVCEHRVGDSSPLEVRLAKAHGRTIRFRIHGATPEQLAQAKCFLFDTNLDLPESCLRGRPDASGFWQVRGLPNEHTYTSLRVAIPGMLCDPLHAVCGPHPDSGYYEFQFTMCPKVTRTLRGRVTTADGTPLAGVVVEARSNFGGDSRCVTDGDGSFSTVTSSPDGENVWFQLAGSTLVLDGPGLEEFTSPKNRRMHGVRLPCEGEVRLTAVPAAGLRVVCTHADGSPVVSAFTSVEIEWQPQPGRQFTSQLATGSTDERGEVAIVGLHPHPGATVFVHAKTDGWEARSADVRLEAAGEVAVRIQGPPVGALCGIVRDTTGKPLPGETIGVYSDAARHPEWAMHEATSDDCGRFSFASLAAGEYRFGPVRPDRSSWRSDPFVVTVGAELQRDVVPGTPS